MTNQIADEKRMERDRELHVARSQGAERVSVADSLIAALQARTVNAGLCDPRASVIQAEDAISIVRRHYDGRLAVGGKPLELQTRDELLAYIRQNEGRAL